MKIQDRRKNFTVSFLSISLLLLFVALTIGATSTPLHFQGRFVGLLCERLSNGQLQVHDQIIDNGLSVDFNINDISNPTQLSSNHRWGGKSRNGILSNARLAQIGQITGSLANGSIRFSANLTLDLNGKSISLPYTISTDALNLPGALPTGIGARPLQIVEKNKAATVALAGVTPLDTNTATIFRDLLQKAGQKVGNGQLLFVTSFDGKITSVP